MKPATRKWLTRTGDAEMGLSVSAGARIPTRDRVEQAINRLSDILRLEPMWHPSVTLPKDLLVEDLIVVISVARAALAGEGK